MESNSWKQQKGCADSMTTLDESISSVGGFKVKVLHVCSISHMDLNA